MVTDVTIIPETGPLQKEAGKVQGVVARQEKRRGVSSERNILTFLPLGDNFRVWQVGRYPSIPHFPALRLYGSAREEADGFQSGVD
jgi:hypothetical protein